MGKYTRIMDQEAEQWKGEFSPKSTPLETRGYPYSRKSEMWNKNGEYRRTLHIKSKHFSKSSPEGQLAFQGNINFHNYSLDTLYAEADSFSASVKENLKFFMYCLIISYMNTMCLAHLYPLPPPAPP